jgi:nuclear pore complex protein Nup133
MAAFVTTSPPPRRKNRAPSRQAALEPPPRRSARIASSKPASRLPTPAHGTEHPSFKEDVTVGSMAVDGDTLQPTERGLRQDTVFAESEEMLVTFHGHLPAEVKHVLKNAGERSPYFPSWSKILVVL